MPKLITVVQGNVRPGLDQVLAAVQRFSDSVVLSTWKGEQQHLTKGDFELVVSNRPEEAGLSNRNLQRVSTVAGLRRAAEMKADFVLKWRTDMLPTAMTKAKLLSWALRDVPSGSPSRLVLSPFRSKALSPDWFSSLPDLYAFGHLEMMRLLWEAEEFDIARPFNVPPEMLKLPGLEIVGGRLFFCGDDCTSAYDPHTECWAWFKNNLQRCVKREICHFDAALEFLSMPDHRRWKICWFRAGDQRLRYRSIAQATGKEWITESAWKSRKLPAVVPFRQWYYCGSTPIDKVRNIIVSQTEILRQRLWYSRYQVVAE